MNNDEKITLAAFAGVAVLIGVGIYANDKKELEAFGSQWRKTSARLAKESRGIGFRCSELKWSLELGFDALTGSAQHGRGTYTVSGEGVKSRLRAVFADHDGVERTVGEGELVAVLRAVYADVVERESLMDPRVELEFLWEPGTVGDEVLVASHVVHGSVRIRATPCPGVFLLVQVTLDGVARLLAGASDIPTTDAAVQAFAEPLRKLLDSTGSPGLAATLDALRLDGWQYDTTNPFLASRSDPHGSFLLVLLEDSRFALRYLHRGARRAVELCVGSIDDCLANLLEAPPREVASTRIVALAADAPAPPALATASGPSADEVRESAPTSKAELAVGAPAPPALATASGPSADEPREDAPAGKKRRRRTRRSKRKRKRAGK